MTIGENGTPESHFRSSALIALVVLTLVRLLAGAVAPLSPDEAYYRVWSRALAPGYLDHPPMVALWIRVGTAFAGETTLGVRLLGPLSAAIGSVLLADAARVLFPGRGAWFRSAVLLNATLLMGAGAVTMTPDTPLLFFWIAAIWALARVATGAGGRWWLAVGLAAGLGLDSKYTAGLLGVGAALWLLTPAMRPQLRTPWPWLGGVVAMATFLPVLLWNAGHGWASFAKQGGRAAVWAPGSAIRYVAELVGGQVGLATPLVFLLFVAGIVGAVRRRRDPRFALLAALVLPGAAMFLQHALGDRVQANWVAVLYPGAALAAGVVETRWWRPAAMLGFGVTAALYVQAVVPVALPRGLDPTTRLAGWDTLTRATAAAARRDGDAFLASQEYGPAALLAWYAPGLPVWAAAQRWTLFDLPQASGAQAGLLLLSQRRRDGPDPVLWQSAELIGTVARVRAGLEVEVYSLYRVVRMPGAPGAVLPQPNRTRDEGLDGHDATRPP